MWKKMDDLITLRDILTSLVKEKEYTVDIIIRLNEFLLSYNKLFPNESVRKYLEVLGRELEGYSEEEIPQYREVKKPLRIGTDIRELVERIKKEKIIEIVVLLTPEEYDEFVKNIMKKIVDEGYKLVHEICIPKLSHQIDPNIIDVEKFREQLADEDIYPQDLLRKDEKRE